MVTVFARDCAGPKLATFLLQGRFDATPIFLILLGGVSAVMLCTGVGHCITVDQKQPLKQIIESYTFVLLQWKPCMK
jgi:hypothetical protein